MASERTGGCRHEIFVSYAHEDADWIKKLELDKNPRALESARFWIDRDRIHASDRWTVGAEEALERATAVVLLISKAFLDSSNINEYELPVITRRYRKNEIIVVFVPIGDVSTEQIGEKLGINDIGSITSVPPWTDPLGPHTKELGRVRRKIVSAATEESEEVQNLRDKLQDKYDLKKSLGTGLLGEVLTAEDDQLKREVAVKLLRRTDPDSEFKNSIVKVARVADHSNILSIYGAYLDSDPPHYIRQYVEGRSLRTILDDGQERSINYVRQFLKGIGAAVSHAHRKNVCDLNIKPSSIIVANHKSPSREFFLSLSSYREEGFLQDQDEKSCATHRDVLYLPLEYRNNINRYDHDPRKADQYRVGLVAYEMLIGSAEFEKLGKPLRLRDLERNDFRWEKLATLRDDCVEYLCGVVDRMVKTDPEERYDSIGDVVIGVERTNIDLEIVRDSYHRLMGSDESQNIFFRSFYISFLRKYPEAKQIFQESGFGDLSEEDEPSEEWQRQFQALKEAVLLLTAFSALQEGGREPNILTRIVEKHAKKDISASLYEDFCSVLIDTVLKKDTAAGSDGAQLKRAWVNVVRPGIDYMKEKTEEIKRREQQNRMRG